MTIEVVDDGGFGGPISDCPICGKTILGQSFSGTQWNELEADVDCFECDRCGHQWSE